MKKIISYIIILLSFASCKAQKTLKVKYIGYQYDKTQNISFIKKQLSFLKENKDTLKMNLRLPYDNINNNVINSGVFYNCKLMENMIYTFKLKKICTKNIPEAFNSYYKINTISNKNDCSKFSEIKLDTLYKYIGNYEIYIDIDDILYEIIGLSPDNQCVFPH